MGPTRNHPERRRIFLWVVLACIALAVGYTFWGILRANASASLMQAQGTPLPVAGANELESIQNQPHIVYLREVGPHYGEVTVAAIDGSSPKSLPTPLKCDRIYYAASSGICLLYDTSTAAQNPLTHIPVWVTLFGSDFQPRHQFTIDGSPSRARLSPDGKYAAFTIFVTGHSYNDVNMSTATILLDTNTGASLGNLEEFETWKDGKLFQAPDFNFWGITFAQDSNRFYATLRNGETIYLVQGDVAARKLTVLHEGVECPSLSPDGTRIAFKKRMGDRWQLTVLDLATMKEIPLAEKEDVDDQVEWLDNARILYQRANDDSQNWMSVFVVPADGSGEPNIFLQNAASPAVIREQDIHRLSPSLN
jgi:Tol biopolymer transport system component